MELLQAGRRKEASELASDYKIITPVTSAIVLEFRQQYKDAGIAPPSPSSTLSPLANQVLGPAISDSQKSIVGQLNQLNSAPAPPSSEAGRKESSATAMPDSSASRGDAGSGENANGKTIAQTDEKKSASDGPGNPAETADSQPNLPFVLGFILGVIGIAAFFVLRRRPR